MVMRGYELLWGGCRWVMGSYVWLLVVMSGYAVVLVVLSSFAGGYEWLRWVI